jgi:hypothetical protein
MEFGIYPGGVTGDDKGDLAAGPADDPAEILAALRALRAGRPFLVRGYLAFTDPGRHRTQTPQSLEQYAGEGRRLDVVAQYQSDSGDVAGYLEFVRDILRRLGPVISTLQITEEPNVPGNPTLDGYYPDVFRPAPDPGAITAGLLKLHRDLMTAASIPASVPPHITENGWPTGPGRTPERQAEVLHAVLTTVISHSAALNLGAYLHFTLRDAHSSQESLFHRFGLLRDDYTPKPAFAVYQHLIATAAA